MKAGSEVVKGEEMRIHYRWFASPPLHPLLTSQNNNRPLL